MQVLVHVPEDEEDDEADEEEELQSPAHVSQLVTNPSDEGKLQLWAPYARSAGGHSRSAYDEEPQSDP